MYGKKYGSGKKSISILSSLIVSDKNQLNDDEISKILDYLSGMTAFASMQLAKSGIKSLTPIQLAKSASA